MRIVPKRRFAADKTRITRQAAHDAAAAVLALAALAMPSLAAPGEAPLVPLAQMRSAPAVPRTARALGRLEAGASVPLSISLPLRDPAGLQDLLTRLYDPNDALYRHFISQAEFARRFGPTQADFDAVLAFAARQGLSVVHTSKTRSLVDVVGTREAVEAAFGTQLTKYQMADGRVAYANSSAPRVPQSVASKIASVVGLDTVDLYQRSHRHRLTGEVLRPMIQAVPTRDSTGTGPLGGLSPADIKTAYSLTSVAPINLSGLTGQGQTLGLYELDDYLPSDILGYTQQFNLPAASLHNIQTPLFAARKTPSADRGEVTLDIEMMVALAPRATIYVYQGANGTSDRVTLYQQIADDNAAKSISTSFGIDEAAAQIDGDIAPETAAFQQMQAQGQSMFAASGDNGAFDDGTTISVDDPAANPAVTGVGGTKLTLNSNQGYQSETTWNRDPVASAGGGGGISTLFPIPNYQATLKTAASQTMRNVPDVSLNADPQTGYAVYLTNPGKTAAFGVFGGTSAAAPLWAAFTGLVNEQRAVFGLSSTAGFLNPALYTLAQSGQYVSVFHDISDSSNNLKYVAGPGYDNATGLGTFIGDQLLDALSPSTNTPVTLSGSVVDTNGKPVPNASISITTLQITHFFRNPAATGTYDPATGNFTQVLDTQMAADATTGSAKPLTYTVSADAPNLAGQTVSVTPAQTQQLPPLVLSAPQFTFAPNVLQMVSAPYEYAGAGDFATLFGLTLPLTGTGYNLAVWSPAQSAYLYYPTAPADTFHLGQGYWTALPSASYIRRLGTPAPPGTFHISLQQGWNQIGDPFGQNITLSSIQVSAPATVNAPNPAASAIGQSSLVALPLYAYPAGATAYTSLGAGDQIEPWHGYWIYANLPAVLSIPSP